MKIFVTVGTQLPFDRMIRTIDQWAGAPGQTRHDIFAQVGPSQYQPLHIESAAFIEAPEFRRRVREADLVVGHAGMGSIITALEYGKPIIVLPRLAELREHRNDHQLATARRFLAQGRILVAFDENHLIDKLNGLKNFRHSTGQITAVSPQLLGTLRDFLEEGRLPPRHFPPLPASADPLPLAEEV